ncbi:hypothetical protein BpHYR1_020552 [Brachionus plicatilis]|uniref:Uncharacterized protein n=1 Tax=Brachionus plicatilis TaxID=10195 RepID=A0A3M7S8C2_BRAPC|nr:hypothetical protein BpHYR1_020552 [Brachionus plicatilis]
MERCGKLDQQAMLHKAVDPKLSFTKEDKLAFIDVPLKAMCSKIFGSRFFHSQYIFYYILSNFRVFWTPLVLNL